MKFTRLTIREYAESLAIAFILAMIIRHFVVEAFRIPTSSMEPTLIGSETHGDRILVSKFQFDLHPPKRWDIVVFKIDQRRIDYYRSLYASKPVAAGISRNDNGTIEHSRSAEYVNYVKRLVGVPEDTIQLKNGDVFIDGKICRKPRAVEDVLLVPVTSDEMLKRQKPHRQTFSDRWHRLDREPINVRDGVITVAAASPPGECHLRYSYPIQDRVETDKKSTRRREGTGGFHVVGDLKLGFRFRHLGGAGYLTGQLTENGLAYVFYLPLGTGETAKLLCGGREVARAAEPFEAKGEHRLEFSNIDARAVLRIDGDALISFDNDAPDEALADSVPLAGAQTSAAEFGASRCDVAVRDVRLWRDIFYTSDPRQQNFAVGKSFTLGDDEHFMMGDNSPNSFDSRNWGVVKKSNLIGEAFFVFWPIPRWRLIN